MGLENECTAHGLGLSSGQSGERGGDRKKRGGIIACLLTRLRAGFYNKKSDLRYDNLGYINMRRIRAFRAQRTCYPYSGAFSTLETGSGHVEQDLGTIGE